ncbi:toll/interleukin-1 receptor domain-containing protein [Actinophytocola gossypii]|uniref:Toll/interleukin-1 receptor domain-containing protein n=1 Tax=Actinophytocola gossypii TaxID=2812003 RepID=A0ABT2JJ14_9PSEU|nr:toll/interleukin-1 receptor domain-containing protein [Actinophytocola gossypii]MCT2587872.1 toll/interleukin-1 receptor domain-containing protein [Actinophytocola gossypii]
MTKIFINYRTADEPYGATLLDQELSRHFGREMVFRDAESIPLGADFETEIMAAVRDSDILLAVIGPNWLTAADAAGNVLLDNERDFVRREIATALEHGVRVIPVLMNATRIVPGALPADIAGLARCQDVRVDFRNSTFDLGALVDRLRELTGKPIPSPEPERATIKAQFNDQVTVQRDFVIN